MTPQRRWQIRNRDCFREYQRKVIAPSLLLRSSNRLFPLPVRLSAPHPISGLPRKWLLLRVGPLQFLQPIRLSPCVLELPIRTVTPFWIKRSNHRASSQSAFQKRPILFAPRNRYYY